MINIFVELVLVKVIELEASTYVRVFLAGFVQVLTLPGAKILPLCFIFFFLLLCVIVLNHIVLEITYLANDLPELAPQDASTLLLRISN